MKKEKHRKYFVVCTKYKLFIDELSW